MTIEQIKNAKFIGGLIAVAILGLAGGAYQVKVMAGDIKQAKQDAADAVELHKGQQAINEKLTSLITESSTKLQVYLELMGFDQAQAAKWAALPRRPPTDSLGRIYLDQPWLATTDELRVGCLYVVKQKEGDSARIFVDTVWDVREKKK